VCRIKLLDYTTWLPSTKNAATVAMDAFKLRLSCLLLALLSSPNDAGNVADKISFSYCCLEPCANVIVSAAEHRSILVGAYIRTILPAREYSH